MANTPYTFLGPKPGKIVGDAQSKLLIAAQVYEQQRVLNAQQLGPKARARVLATQQPKLQALLREPSQEPPFKKHKSSSQKFVEPTPSFSLSVLLPLSTNMPGRGQSKNAKDAKKDDSKKNKDDSAKVDGADKENSVPNKGASSSTSKDSVPEDDAPGHATPLPLSASTTSTIADKVIDHFTAHWETFKAGFKSDLTALTTKVDTLETTTASLENRVTVLENQGTTSTVDDTALQNRVVTLEQKCSSVAPDGFEVRITALEKKLNLVTEEDPEGGTRIKQPEEFTIMQSDVGLLQGNVETINGYMHIMGRNVHSLDQWTTLNAAKLTRNTLIFGRVRSTDDQPAIDALNIFLNNILHVPPGPDDIIEASKLGKWYKRWVPYENQEIQIPPPIKARCTESFAAKCMNASPSLFKKKDEEFKFKYYVRSSLPEAMRAVRDLHRADIQHYRRLNDEKGEDEPKITYHFNGEKFFVNGEVIEEDIKPPTFHDMISLREETHDAMDKLQFATGGPLTEKESMFQAFAIHASTMEDIDLAYMKVRKYKRYADHIVLGYRLKNEAGIKEGGSSDKEYYGDQVIRCLIRQKHAVNVAVFVSREYGGIPLSPKRFDLIKQVASAALDDMDPKTMNATEEPQSVYPLPQRTQRKRPNRSNRNRQPGPTHNNAGYRGGFRGYQGRGGNGGGGNQARGRDGHQSSNIPSRDDSRDTDVD